MPPVRIPYIHTTWYRTVHDPVDQVDGRRRTDDALVRNARRPSARFILYSSARFGQHSANSGWPRQLAGASSDTQRRRVSAPSPQIPLHNHICGGARPPSPFLNPLIPQDRRAGRSVALSYSHKSRYISV